jgi:hypothetical protein
MKKPDPARFHRLFGERTPRITYRGSDFADYVLMILLCAAVISFVYGKDAPVMFTGGIALCVFMIGAFFVRHGCKLAVPFVLRRPQDVVYTLIYKIENLPAAYFLGAGLLALENYLIYLTPGWPHHVELMRTIAVFLFYLHFLLLTVYRTVSLVDHWRKRAQVKEVLVQSSWKRVALRWRDMRFEILHAYLTGLLAHVVLIAPWYFIITHVKFSVLFMPVVCVLNVILTIRFFRVVNAWFYRDHWLGHNSELEFLYLHGSHHDAIPSGLIGVAGNGFLEGLLRHALAYPTPFFNPVIAFVANCFEVKRDMDFHQYIPGIFPMVKREYRQVGQHSTHHFGRLEPYSFGIKLDQPGVPEAFRKMFGKLPDEFTNGIRLDEELNQFEWDNPRRRWYVEICRKYESEAGRRP